LRLQNFQKHIKDFYASQDFKVKAQNAVPFFKSVKDYVFGRPTTLENIVRFFVIFFLIYFDLGLCYITVECKSSRNLSFFVKSLRAWLKVYDFINTQLVHNKTYAYRLPPTIIEQARHWANYHEAGVFSDKDITGVGNSMSYI